MKPLVYWLIWLLIDVIGLDAHQGFWLIGSARRRRQGRRKLVRQQLEETSQPRLAALKSDPSARVSHPVVLPTGPSAPDGRMNGLGVRADNYLRKPIRPAELVMPLGSLLQTRQPWQWWLATQSTFSYKTIETTVLPAKEERFLTRLREQILSHLDQEPLDVDWLAAQANMSRTHLHRKLTALTTLSPNRFIHRVRVERAAELIQSGKLNVAQAAYQVGYNSPSHFTKVFQEHLGYLPAQLKV
jgi:AraC-like DNA-binding protein